MGCPSFYVHIPFCSRKCLFCSFAVAISQEHRREDYIKALAAEMKNFAGTRIATIYLGGGTPSLLDENHLADLMEAVKKNFSWNAGIEITIEANPESINEAKARFLKHIGFNRISLGIQSLDDRYLRFLGRNHDAAAARRAYQALREAGFDNVNLDLMYAFPAQTMEELERDVHALAALGSEHLSLYTLTIEPNSKFHAARMVLDDDEKLAQQYTLIGRILRSYGLGQYEISNFAKEGFESAHNRNYWLGRPYIGLGVGAHGFDGRRRSWNTPRLHEYLVRALGNQPPMEGYEDLSGEQLVMEKVLFGLRMNEGIPRTLVPADRQAKIETWIRDGFLMQEQGKLKATDRGRLVLDELSGRLI